MGNCFGKRTNRRRSNAGFAGGFDGYTSTENPFGGMRDSVSLANSVALLDIPLVTLRQHLLDRHDALHDVRHEVRHEVRPAIVTRESKKYTPPPAPAPATSPSPPPASAKLPVQPRRNRSFSTNDTTTTLSPGEVLLAKPYFVLDVVADASRVHATLRAAKFVDGVRESPSGSMFGGFVMIDDTAKYNYLREPAVLLMSTVGENAFTRFRWKLERSCNFKTPCMLTLQCIRSPCPSPCPSPCQDQVQDPTACCPATEREELVRTCVQVSPQSGTSAVRQASSLQHQRRSQKSPPSSLSPNCCLPPSLLDHTEKMAQSRPREPSSEEDQDLYLSCIEEPARCDVSEATLVSKQPCVEILDVV
jgi:hypothetical protein